MRRLPEDKEQELRDLSAYVGFFSTVVVGLSADDPVHPTNVMNRWAGKVPKSQLLSGLKQAARDTIEASQVFRPEQVEAFDNKCKKQGVLTLSEIRHRYGRRGLGSSLNRNRAPDSGRS